MRTTQFFKISLDFKGLRKGTPAAPRRRMTVIALLPAAIAALLFIATLTLDPRR